MKAALTIFAALAVLAGPALGQTSTTTQATADTGSQFIRQEFA